MKKCKIDPRQLELDFNVENENITTHSAAQLAQFAQEMMARLEIENKLKSLRDDFVDDDCCFVDLNDDHVEIAFDDDF